MFGRKRLVRAKNPVLELQQDKTVVTHRKHREKLVLSQQPAAERVVVENNFLGATSSDKLDKAIEKIRNGDKTLATANELIKLENADKRSDALVSKFNKDPSQLNSAERAELAAYLRVYASEMEKEYGTAVAQELVTGLLSGQDYIKRNPDTEAMAKAQSIMNTCKRQQSAVLTLIYR